jgi:hypothetical protein
MGNLQLLAAPAETTRAIAEEQGGRKVGRRESDARRGGVRVGAYLLPVWRKAVVRVSPLTEVWDK